MNWCCWILGLLSLFFLFRICPTAALEEMKKDQLWEILVPIDGWMSYTDLRDATARHMNDLGNAKGQYKSVLAAYAALSLERVFEEDSAEICAASVTVLSNTNSKFNEAFFAAKVASLMGCAEAMPKNVAELMKTRLQEIVTPDEVSSNDTELNAATDGILSWSSVSSSLTDDIDSIDKLFSGKNAGRVDIYRTILLLDMLYPSNSEWLTLRSSLSTIAASVLKGRRIANPPSITSRSWFQVLLKDLQLLNAALLDETAAKSLDYRMVKQLWSPLVKLDGFPLKRNSSTTPLVAQLELAWLLLATISRLPPAWLPEKIADNRSLSDSEISNFLSRVIEPVLSRPINQALQRIRQDIYNPLLNASMDQSNNYESVRVSNSNEWCLAISFLQEFTPISTANETLAPASARGNLPNLYRHWGPLSQSKSWPLQYTSQRHGGVSVRMIMIAAGGLPDADCTGRGGCIDLAVEAPGIRTPWGGGGVEPDVKLLETAIAFEEAIGHSLELYAVFDEGPEAKDQRLRAVAATKISRSSYYGDDGEVPQALHTFKIPKFPWDTDPASRSPDTRLSALVLASTLPGLLVRWFFIGSVVLPPMFEGKRPSWMGGTRSVLDRFSVVRSDQVWRRPMLTGEEAPLIQLTRTLSDKVQVEARIRERELAAPSELVQAARQLSSIDGRLSAHNGFVMVPQPTNSGIYVGLLVERVDEPRGATSEVAGRPQPGLGATSTRGRRWELYESGEESLRVGRPANSKTTAFFRATPATSTGRFSGPEIDLRALAQDLFLSNSSNTVSLSVVISDTNVFEIQKLDVMRLQVVLDREFAAFRQSALSVAQDPRSRQYYAVSTRESLWHPKVIIKNQFAAPLPTPPPVFPGVFLVLLLGSTISFWWLRKPNFWENIHFTAPTKSTVLFSTLLVGAGISLIVYWITLNFIRLVQMSLLVAPVAFVVGRCVMVQIRNRKNAQASVYIDNYLKKGVYPDDATQ